MQGAIDYELQPLLDALEGRRSRQISAWTFWEGRIGAKQVVVSRTEVGPINAVAATVLGIEHYQPSLIINHETAGAHNPELRLWDIVVGERTVDYGAYTSDHADAGSGISRRAGNPIPTVCDLMAGRGLHSTHLAEMRARSKPPRRSRIHVDASSEERSG